MFFITALDFTASVKLFEHLQNRGNELLIKAGRKIMKSVRCPFVLVITCDRAELISEEKVSPEILERALSVSPIEAAACRYSISPEDSVRHILLLATGILSPLFGEDTIQGQLTSGAECARLIGSSSPALDKLISSAVSFSRRIHSSRKIRVIDKIIIEKTAEIVKDCSKILIVGSGECARLVAERIKGCHEVTMTLRDADKTYLVPDGVRPSSYDDRIKDAEKAEAIISASSGLYHTFTSEELAELDDNKILIDLASPPDLPDYPEVIRISDMDIDLPERNGVIAYVSSEAEKEEESFYAYIEKSKAMPDLKEEADALSYEVMRRLSSVITSLSLPEEKDREVREAVLSSVHKAYISKTISRINGKH